MKFARSFATHHFQIALAFLVAVTVFSGCEKTVTVELPNVDDKIVVEGYIETGQPPYVILSRSLDFFGTVNLNSIVQNTIQGATVTVSDGFITDTLQQIPGFGVYVSQQLTGTPGRTYYLIVRADGEILTAKTLLPNPVELDSVWWKVDGQRDSLGFAWAHLSDPDTLGNYYRWFARRINRYTYGELAGQQKDSIFIAPLGSVFEDKFINGRSFDFNAARGRLRNSDKEDDLNEESFFFKRGDTIVVKFTSIDRAHFEFWRSEETQVSNNGNPFGSITPITSNINGGLGIWGAYSTTFDTIYAQ
ncbi:MAG: hypothetical protein RIQ47_1425 [Bacteroidota bacterium]|jgi:hypothetical protein